MKKQDLFCVSKVETNERLQELSRERGDVFCRIAIAPNGTTDGLNEEQKRLLESLDDDEKELTLKGQLKREISNVFRISSFVEGLDDLTDEDLTDESQNDFVSQLENILKGKNKKNEQKKFVFTYFTFSVEELLKGTEYDGTTVLFDESGTMIRSRNNLYFGFFDDDEEAFNFMRGRLVDAIEDDTLSIENPNGGTTEKQPEPQHEKRQISLKH